MPISYSNELKAWDLSQATLEESEQIMMAGMSYLVQRLGARVLEVQAERDEGSAMLHQIPPEGMAQA